MQRISINNGIHNSYGFPESGTFAMVANGCQGLYSVWKKTPIFSKSGYKFFEVTPFLRANFREVIASFLRRLTNISINDTNQLVLLPT
jgi:hypothetical protein